MSTVVRTLEYHRIWTMCAIERAQRRNPDRENQDELFLCECCRIESIEISENNVGVGKNNHALKPVGTTEHVGIGWLAPKGLGDNLFQRTHCRLCILKACSMSDSQLRDGASESTSAERVIAEATLIDHYDDRSNIRPIRVLSNGE